VSIVAPNLPTSRRLGAVVREQQLHVAPDSLAGSLYRDANGAARCEAIDTPWSSVEAIIAPEHEPHVVGPVVAFRLPLASSFVVPDAHFDAEWLNSEAYQVGLMARAISRALAFFPDGVTLDTYYDAVTDAGWQSRPGDKALDLVLQRGYAERCLDYLIPGPRHPVGVAKRLLCMVARGDGDDPDDDGFWPRFLARVKPPD
jgi:hypothetical protein